MATEIKMPQLSDTMDSGKILTWNKKEGDSVQRGDILAEVETDKANLEIESFHSGVLLKIVTPENQSAEVGKVIAYIGQPGEAIPDGTGAPSANGSAAETSQAKPETAKPEQPTPAQELRPAEEGAEVSQPSETTPRQDGRIKASPLAKKIAAQRNIDLSTVRGSGPDGRIVRRDVEGAAPQEAPARPQPAAVQPASVPQQAAPQRPSPQPQVGRPAEGGVPGMLVPMSKVRETIARRMQQTVVEAPHFYVTTTVEMSEAVKLRALLKERQEYKGISLNHLIIKAAGYALQREPRVHYAVRDETFILQPAQINIGIITALDDGLLIPVVHGVDQLTLKDVVFEARAAVERARAGRPSSSDLVGGTFSISNMGMFDVESFTALINPGQGSVLAVSSIREEPVIKNGQIVVGQTMKVTISVDHRIIDGVMAGTFLKYFREALEAPALLLA